MNTPDDPVKKIVSKGKYVQVQGQRAGTILWGMGLIVVGVVCAVITLCLIVWSCVELSGGSHMNVVLVLALAVLAALFGAATYMLGNMGLTKMDRAEQMNNVVPLTRTTAPYLSSPESLVRASEEPTPEPEGVLLRPAAETQETRLEQLVRSADKQE